MKSLFFQTGFKRQLHMRVELMKQGQTLGNHIAVSQGKNVDFSGHIPRAFLDGKPRLFNGSDRFGNVGVKQSTVFIERYAVAVTVKEFHIQFAFQLANGL